MLEGKFIVEHRSMLLAEVFRDGKRLADSEYALNDIVVRCGAAAQAITLRAQSEDRFLADFFGDGLIIATPTGSTAYALAASGPIVEPSLDVTLIVPICPHSLTQRPIILPAERSVCVRLDQRRPSDKISAIMSVDGRPGTPLQIGDEIRVRRAETTLRLLLPPDRSFFEVLRSKLKWSQR